jgi:peroxiredoxin
MLSEGMEAPDFSLPGVMEGERTTYELDTTTSNDNTVLLLFYPFDFSPVCTNELCAIRDAEWFQFTPNLDVWAVSGDSIYAHEAFIEAYNLTFPLLSDYHATAADRYDVRYDQLEGHEAVPKRAVFLIAPDRTIVYAWATDDAFEKPDFAPVKTALDELRALDPECVPGGSPFERPVRRGADPSRRL